MPFLCILHNDTGISIHYLSAWINGKGKYNSSTVHWFNGILCARDSCFVCHQISTNKCKIEYENSGCKNNECSFQFVKWPAHNVIKQELLSTSTDGRQIEDVRLIWNSTKIYAFAESERAIELNGHVSLQYAHHHFFTEIISVMWY